LGELENFLLLVVAQLGRGGRAIVTGVTEGGSVDPGAVLNLAAQDHRGRMKARPI
jgi:hypothetical protein